MISCEEIDDGSMQQTTLQYLWVHLHGKCFSLQLQRRFPLVLPRAGRHPAVLTEHVLGATAEESDEDERFVMCPVLSQCSRVKGFHECAGRSSH